MRCMEALLLGVLSKHNYISPTKGNLVVFAVIIDEIFVLGYGSCDYSFSLFTFFALVSTVSRLTDTDITLNTIHTPPIPAAIHSYTVIISSQRTALTAIPLQTLAPVRANLVYTLRVLQTTNTHTVIDIEVTVRPRVPRQTGTVTKVLTAVGDAGREVVSYQALHSEAEGYVGKAKFPAVFGGCGFRSYLDLVDVD